MEQVKALVLRAAGINCDLETEYAFELAGAEAERVHINRIIENPSMLDGCQIMVFPGGFSYGDDVAAGKILANQIVHHLFDAIKRFIENGKLVLGICNGFQVLVKAGILGDTDDSDRQSVTITYNDSGKFEDRWVYLQPSANKCVFIEPEKRIYLPIAHGEGKVVCKDDSVLETLKSNGKVSPQTKPHSCPSPSSTRWMCRPCWIPEAKISTECRSRVCSTISRQAKRTRLS